MDRHQWFVLATVTVLLMILRIGFPAPTLAKLVVTIGLATNAAGAVLIIQTSRLRTILLGGRAPAEDDPTYFGLMQKQYEAADRRMLRNYRLGFVLLLYGFVLQIVAIW